MIGPKPVQRQILQYLSDLSEASVSAISTSTGIKRSSIQRSLRAMKGRGLTGDRWMDYAPAVVPGIKAHMWSITNQGRGELKLLQFVTEEHEPYPLGYRILLFMSHGGLMTIGQIAKIVRKDRGHVKRVVQSLQNKGLVECLYGKTRTSFGPDMIMHL
jgi:DNA-binding MarR family transcriptional regulator